MNFIKNILSILLVTVVLNTVVTKGLHELFEHHNEVHTCIDIDTTHYHNHEFSHPDFICDFNISTTLLNVNTLFTKGIAPYVDGKSIINDLWIVTEACIKNIKPRGPPLLNS